MIGRKGVVDCKLSVRMVWQLMHTLMPLTIICRAPSSSTCATTGAVRVATSKSPPTHNGMATIAAAPIRTPVGLVVMVCFLTCRSTALTTSASTTTAQSPLDCNRATEYFHQQQRRCLPVSDCLPGQRMVNDPTLTTDRECEDCPSGSVSGVDVNRDPCITWWALLLVPVCNAVHSRTKSAIMLGHLSG